MRYNAVNVVARWLTYYKFRPSLCHATLRYAERGSYLARGCCCVTERDPELDYKSNDKWEGRRVACWLPSRPYQRDGLHWRTAAKATSRLSHKMYFWFFFLSRSQAQTVCKKKKTVSTLSIPLVNRILNVSIKSLTFAVQENCEHGLSYMCFLCNRWLWHRPQCRILQRPDQSSLQLHQPSHLHKA